MEAVVRAKGTFWLATRPAYIGLMSKAGPSYVLEPIGTWWATLPETHWGLPDDERQAILSDWHPDWGDRTQQLVFIGIGIDKSAIRARLEAALVTDAEAEAGIVCWHGFRDPLPVWA